jgi:hypothetical protein
MARAMVGTALYAALGKIHPEDVAGFSKGATGASRGRRFRPRASI